jgi:hypothetical protein
MPMNMPMTQDNMMNMNKGAVEERQIEMLYPHSYYIIYPHVRAHCDKLEQKHGKMYCPSKEEFEKILEDICDKVEKELEDDEDKKDKDKDDCREEERRRRRRYNRRRLLGDLAGVILIGELLGRRQPYYGPGYYGPGYWY